MSNLLSNRLPGMSKTIWGKRYRVDGATLLADDEFWDGHNFDRGGRNTFLYRTPKGAYFKVRLSNWQGEDDTITPLSEGEARALYESLSEQHVEVDKAFPNVEVEDA